jgi:hypothetical protein
MGKLYIPVILHIDETGQVTPTKLKAGYDNEWLKIIKVKDSRRRASLKAGTVGTRYRCVVDIYGDQREIYLFDEGLKWFIEVEE